MKIKSLYLMTCVVAVLAACSQPPRPPEEVVAERAQARWDAMVAGDYETVWELHTPGYRQMTPLSALKAERSGRPFRWIGYEPGRVSCEESRCTAEAKVRFKVVAAPGGLSGFEGEQKITDVWLQIDGNWWYSPP